MDQMWESTHVNMQINQPPGKTGTCERYRQCAAGITAYSVSPHPAHNFQEILPDQLDLSTVLCNFLLLETES